MVTDDWEQRLAEAWSLIGQRHEAEFLATVNQLAAELPPDSPVAIFERAAALDSTGHPDRAVPLYRQVLDLGLIGERRRRAVIQLASSLRNLGEPRESAALLRAEVDAESDHLDDAVRAFLALALADIGKEREALSLALGSLARHLPRYQYSLANYARTLSGEPDRTRREITLTGHARQSCAEPLSTGPGGLLPAAASREPGGLAAQSACAGPCSGTR